MDREAASVEVRLKDGRIIDVNNVSGQLKKKLVAEGKIQLDHFVMPSNMPGKKLKELRAKHSAAFIDSQKRAEEYTKSKKAKSAKVEGGKEVSTPKPETSKTPKIEFEKGEVVLLGKHQTKVLKFREKDNKTQYLVKTREGKKVWKFASEITKVNLDEPEVEVDEED